MSSGRGLADNNFVTDVDDSEFLAEASFAGDADEEVKDPCAVCFTNRNYSKEATHFCGECGLLGHFLCEPCLGFHKKFTAHKDVKSFVAAKYKKSEVAKLQKQETAGDKTPSTSANTDKDLKQKYEQTYKELNDAKAEISELKNRIRQIVDAKEKNNNPNITDLSDENRPTKLAEKYLELYDNEWTDAYEEVENELSNEQDIITHLYQRLLDVFDFCQKSSEEYSKSFKSCALGLPSPTVENGRPKYGKMGVTHVRQLKELKKSFSPFLVEDVFQNYVKSRKLKLEKKSKTAAFIRKCVEICWLMSSQDPPVILDTGNVKGPFDGDRYRTYAKTGKTVDFVVWPPMLLHKDGPLLSKGVAQGK